MSKQISLANEDSVFFAKKHHENKKNFYIKIDLLLQLQMLVT